MKMTAKFEAEGENFNACFEQLNSAFNAEFSASGGGQDGKDGATFIPSVSDDGIISWTNDRDLQNPKPVNIKGDKGDTGANGKDGTNGVNGKDGKDGFSPIVSVTDVEGGHKVTITDKEGEKTFDVMDGKDGQGGGGGVTSWNDLTDKPDFAPVATSGSWNDLTDKPFGEVSAFDIQWNGDMTDKFALEMSMLGYNKGTYFVKVDDAVFTPEDIVWGTISISNGNRFTVMGSDIDTQSFPGAYKIRDYVGIVHNQSLLNNALGLPDGYITNGTYFFINTNLFTNRFTSPRKIVPLDEKYIPDIIARKTDIPESGSWNDLTDKPFGEGEAIEWKEVAYGLNSQTGSLTNFSVTPTSSFTLILEKNYKIVVNAHMVGSRETIGIASKRTNPDFSDSYTIGSVDDAVRLSGRATSDGMISAFTITLAEPIQSIMGVTVTVYEENRAVKLLDEKYLPDSVVLESELEAKGYQTEEQVTALINDIVAGLPDYLETLGYQTEEQVKALINNALGVIENGTY